MKKFNGNHQRPNLLWGGVVFCVGVVAVWLTTPSFGFSSMGEMGTSATGMALIRSIIDPPPGTSSPFMGYVFNGTIHHYWNWPPNGFRVYAWWLDLTGVDTLSAARMLSAIVYGFSALFFYGVLRKNKVSQATAFASSLVFLFLPLHLKYGHMVYSDIWLPFFWTLALYALKAESLNRYWLFALIILLGTTFMWFVIFLLPFPLVMKLLRKYYFSKQVGIAIWVGVYMMALSAVWILVMNFSDEYRILKLESWSFHKLLRDDTDFFPQLVDRIKYLGYESLSLLVLFGISVKALKRWPEAEIQTRVQGLIKLITILFSGLLLYVLIMPKWFVVHHYGVSMFSVLIATAIAFVLSVVEHLAREVYVRNTLSVVLLTLVLYAIFPSDRKHVASVNRLSEAINQQTFAQKPCIFIDLKNFRQWQHAVDFGIKELTEGYIFNQDFLHPNQEEKWFQQASDQLDALGISDYDPNRFLIITNDETHTQTSERLVVEIDKVRVYQVMP